MTHFRITAYFLSFKTFGDNIKTFDSLLNQKEGFQARTNEDKQPVLEQFYTMEQSLLSF